MLNNVVLIGRLTADPELKYSGSGVGICNFTLAVNRSFSGANGEKQADFVDIVCFKKQAENVANFLSKGSLCAIEGRIQVRPWETSDGQKRKSVEVVADSVKFLEKPKSSGSSSGQRPSSKSHDEDGWEALGRVVESGDVDMVDDDDSIPF